MSRYIDADKQTDRAYQLNFDKKISERELAIVNRLITESPTEDVAPVVHAHWNETRLLGIYKCSACKSLVEMYMQTCAVYLKRYCPECGAKMDEKEKEE